MNKKAQIRKSGVILGRNLERLRLYKQVSRRDLAKKIKKSDQQIAKYENGAFVPLPIIEAITAILGEPVPKKIIRKISFTRKLEVEEKVDMEEKLIELYNEAVELIEDEE